MCEGALCWHYFHFYHKLQIFHTIHVENKLFGIWWILILVASLTVYMPCLRNLDTKYSHFLVPANVGSPTFVADYVRSD